MIPRRVLAVCALVCVVASPLRGQSSPFFPDALFATLVNEISGDRSFENVRHLTHFHRTGASKDFFKAAEWILQAAKDAGVEDVRLIRQKHDRPGWSCSKGEVWLLGNPEFKLASYSEVAVSIADNSRTTHVTADLVDVGSGIEERDYQGKDVKGKVVLAGGAMAKVMQEAVWKRGALGVLSYQTNRPEHFDAPDHVAWAHVPYEAKNVDGVKEGTPGTFAVMISPRRGRVIQKQLAKAPAKIRVDIEAEFQAAPEQAMVEGWIRGSEIPDQQIVLTAHIQEEMTSANDDGSGCGNVLEIGRALSALIKEGKIPRPRRDIRFWWVNEFASQERFFRENPSEPRKMLVALNQDMVGARQSLGGRVEYASRLPWSIPHVLDDVMESVVTLVRDTNTSLLTTRGTALPQPFTREIVSVKGSREPYHARMVPYYGSTDHHAFTPAHIGVPASSLTNWPDEFIHSTGDDLEQIDATQLERNAVVVAGVALYFANVNDAELPALARSAGARALSRLAADGATATALLGQGTDRLAGYHAARNLVAHSAGKERAALASIERLASAPGGPLRTLLDTLAGQISRLEADLGKVYDDAYVATTDKKPEPRVLSADEQALASRVYGPAATIGEIQDGLDKMKPVEAMHGMMRFETLNFADGKRTGLEVYDAVSAEAASGGEWYYGRVTPADVKEVLERAVKAGACTVKETTK